MSSCAFMFSVLLLLYHCTACSALVFPTVKYCKFPHCGINKVLILLPLPVFPHFLVAWLFSPASSFPPFQRLVVVFSWLLSLGCVKFHCGYFSPFLSFVVFLQIYNSVLVSHFVCVIIFILINLIIIILFPIP